MQEQNNKDLEIELSQNQQDNIEQDLFKEAPLEMNEHPIEEKQEAPIPPKKKAEKPTKTKKKEQKPVKPNTEASFSPIAKIAGFISLCFLTSLFALPLLFEPRAAFTFESIHIQAFEYMQNTGAYILPMLGESIYHIVYPLSFWLLHLLDSLNPTGYIDLFFLFSSCSLLLFAISTYCLALALGYSARVALGAACISLCTTLVLILGQSLQINMLFASLISFSLLFFFRAWIQNFSVTHLLFAFFFMTLAFFTNGSLAFFIPLGVSILFLLLRGNFLRLFKSDGLLGFILFLVCLGLAYMYAYMEAGSDYIVSLISLDCLRYTQFAQFFEENLALLFLTPIFLFPFIFIPFFVNWKKAIVSGKGKLKLCLPSTLKSLEFERLCKQEKGETSAKIDKVKYAEYVRACGLLFLCSSVIIILTSIFLFSNGEVSSFLLLIPSISLLFSRAFMNFSKKSNRAYWIFIAFLVFCFGCFCLAFSKFDILGSISPEYLKYIPGTLLDLMKSVEQLPFVGVFFIVLALLLLVISKMYPQRVLYILIIALAGLIALIHFLILPYVLDYLF